MSGYLDDDDVERPTHTQTAPTDTSTAASPPGWYQRADDPPGSKRYWDGSTWTGNFVPGAHAAQQPERRSPELEGEQLHVLGPPKWLNAAAATAVAVAAAAGWFAGLLTDERVVEALASVVQLH